ncbi:hypothetical protein EV127DRAFT_412459 [Xylaria flabelliformis]|nr:hypothetical protein EV127DRAFT_412459 [Xylaria flabelliformis]
MDPAVQKSTETPSEDIKRCYEMQYQILKVLEQLRDDQRDHLSLQRRRWGLAYDIPQVARELWVNGTDAWVGFNMDLDWACMHLGTAFFKSLVPNIRNLQAAKVIFEKWVREPGAYPACWNKDFLANPELTEYRIRHNEYQWPYAWEIPMGTPWDCDDFNHDTKDFPKASKSNMDICGIIVQFSISRFSDIIDLNNAAAIISFVQGGLLSQNGPEFLDGHIAQWRERSEHDRYSFLEFRLDDGPTIPGSWRIELSGVIMHYMRSFIVVDLTKKATHTRPHAPGLKCLRENITFRGFYSATKTKLIEKRYSIAVRLLPLKKPAGHYALVSICDGQDIDVRFMFEKSPGSIENGSGLWAKYGIYPAGLYTGISIFQLQLCVCIDSWEQDWIFTMRRIDEMVSLRFNVLENDKELRRVVLENSTDASVSYFKVLQILNTFSDMVRAAPSYLDALSTSVRHSSGVDYWFTESYPHTENTQHILQHNWKIVRERQNDASSRILAKLERTTNEVKSLQSGSITEARKSRTLNKYLLVFTIVTILFLPPTFVATFFGMHIFDANTIGTTQRLFWAVLGALSGGTYLLAALGLFGSHLSAEERNIWGTSFKESLKESRIRSPSATRSA